MVRIGCPVWAKIYDRQVGILDDLSADDIFVDETHPTVGVALSGSVLSDR